MEKSAKDFTFYLLTSYGPAVGLPVLLMEQAGYAFTDRPIAVLSFAALYGAFIAICDPVLLEPARRAAAASGSHLKTMTASMLACALAGAGLFSLIDLLAH